jgi:type III secretion protein V
MRALALRQHRADVVLALALVAMVGMMIVPLPTPLLDVLIASNIAAAVLMLLVAVVIPDSLVFTAMPTMLLVTTLYRLALNVSSTRLILLQADAGQVIRSFGDFVVRGDYVVGAVVFLILIIIQYVVVARGAERVAEVGARFSLDAMPGKQLAIDGDLRGGAIDATQASERRRTLERENHFYGAMDGAMKFVKGDAIAGIVITIVNIIAGVGIGVGMRDLDTRSSLEIYGLLTIGDGLVAQIPSLLVAASAGLVVTRVASGDEGSSLGHDIGTQLFSDPRVLATGGLFLAVLAVVPGLPALPFGLLALALGTGAWLLRNTPRPAHVDGRAHAGRPPPAPLAVALGNELASVLQVERGAPTLHAALDGQSERLHQQLGLSLPQVHVEHDATLDANAFAVKLDGLTLLQANADADTAATRVAEAFATAVRQHAATLLGVQETQQMLDALTRTHPALVRTVVPTQVSLPVLSQVLQRLLAEGVSVAPLRRILEALASADTKRGPEALAEQVRVALGRDITSGLAHEGAIELHELDFTIEDLLGGAFSETAPEAQPSMAPDSAERFVQAVRERSEGKPIVLVTRQKLRRAAYDLLHPELPGVVVLGEDELPPDLIVDRQPPIALA